MRRPTKKTLVTSWTPKFDVVISEPWLTNDKSSMTTVVTVLGNLEDS